MDIVSGVRLLYALRVDKVGPAFSVRFLADSLVFFIFVVNLHVWSINFLMNLLLWVLRTDLCGIVSDVNDLQRPPHELLPL